MNMLQHSDITIVPDCCSFFCPPPLNFKNSESAEISRFKICKSAEKHHFKNCKSACAYVIEWCRGLFVLWGVMNMIFQRKIYDRLLEWKKETEEPPCLWKARGV